jgi:hypothetical protein
MHVADTAEALAVPRRKVTNKKESYVNFVEVLINEGIDAKKPAQGGLV